MNTKIYQFMVKNKIFSTTENLMDTFLSNMVKQSGINGMLEFLRTNIWVHASAPPRVDAAKLQIMVTRKENLYGLIFYPACSELVKLLNGTNGLSGDLTNVAQTMRVKQLYLDVKIKQTRIIFKFKDFKKNNFKFFLNTSVSNPTNSKLAFGLH